MRLVWQDPDVAAWVAARIPQMEGAGDFGPCQAVGVVSESGEALGGVVFHNWQPRFKNIEVSFASASPRWLSRNLIRGILSYPYAQLGCARITAVTPRRATSARRFLDVFGFRREGLVRRGFGTDDAVISGLLRTEWERSRWCASPATSREPTSAQKEHTKQFRRRRQNAGQSLGSARPPDEAGEGREPVQG